MTLESKVVETVAPKVKRMVQQTTRAFTLVEIVGRAVVEREPSSVV